MPAFVADALCDPVLPVHLGPVVRMLGDFDRRCIALRREPATTSTDQRVAEVRELHARLVELAAVQLPAAHDALPLEDSQRAFAAGAGLLGHYERTVHADVSLVDTVGCRTLAAFHADLERGGEAAVEAALSRMFPTRVLEEVARLRAPEITELERRHAVIAALEDMHPLPEQRFELFDRLYRDAGYVRGEVDIIRTGTSLFFCVSKYPRTEAQKAFVGRVRRTVKQHHFPVFGFYRAEGSDPAMLAQLSAATGFTLEQLAPILTTMMSVLFTEEVDKYVVHDAWGHQWQAHLLPFEDDYQQTAINRRPISLQKGDPGLLAALDVGLRGGTPNYAAVIDADIQARLVAGASPIIAELLADVVEFKLLSTDAAASLQSSSLFADWPTKLDLTLMDARIYFGQTTAPWRSIAREPSALGKQLALARPDVDPVRRAEVVAQFVAVLRTVMRTKWARRIRAVTRDEALWVNPYTRFNLNLLALHATLNQTYSALARRGAWPRPLRDFRDLFVLVVGAFYQHDRRRHLWHMDELLALHLPRLVDALCTELVREGS